MTTDELINKCANIYQNKGYVAVIDFCYTLDLNYKYCQPCDTLTPEKDNYCLICGQKHK